VIRLPGYRRIACLQETQQVIEAGDRPHRNAIKRLHFLGGGACGGCIGRAASFLSIQCNQHRRWRCTMRPDQFDRFTNRGARRDHVIDDHHATSQGSANKRAALAVILCLLAIEGKRQVVAGPCQRNRSGRGQRDALIGGPEEHVELPAFFLLRADQPLGIELGEAPQALAIVKEPGIEEIRGVPAGLCSELAELQDACAQSEADKLVTIFHSHRLYKMLRIVSLNLNGLRSAQRKGVAQWLESHRPDVLCVQEIKAQEADLDETLRELSGARGHFHFAQKKGYSGVGLYAHKTPQAVRTGFGSEEFDAEGRYVEADFGNLTVISVYVPSGSASPERQQAKFRFIESFEAHLRDLKSNGREIVLCGDWNVAHQAIDLKNWKSNQKNSGFLPEERAWLTRIFDEIGFVDVFRRLDPRPEQYTWWSARGQAWTNNVGWRLDYQIATPGLAAVARSASIHTASRFSDHAPVTIDYDFSF